jgi:general secretion pathway protein H
MTKISTLMAHKLKKNNFNTKSGFSLLEIVIVLAIMGSILAIALPRLMDKKSETRKVFREFIVAGKELKGKAKLSGSTYRMAFSMEEKEQSWWVEKSTKVIVLDKKKMEKAQEDEKNKNPDKPPPDFQIDTSIFKKKQILPSGYRFKQIESGTLDLIVSEGMAYIHFFPQGLIETSAIQIEDPKKNVWTIVYNPLTGRSDVIPEAKLLKDLAR